MLFKLNDFREEDVDNIVIIKSTGANFNKNEKEDIVYLMGKSIEKSAIYYDRLNIVILNEKNGRIINLKIENGPCYNPHIYIKDFNGDGVDEILFISHQGENNKYTNANIYSFKNECITEIFNVNSINNDNIYEVNYKNGYSVEIVDKSQNKKYLIDISLKDKKYLDEIYNEKGIVKKLNKGSVLSVEEVGILNKRTNWNLLIKQKVIGLFNSDTLGYINSSLKFNGENVKIIKSLSIEGVDVSGFRGCHESRNIILNNKCSIDFSKVNFIESEKLKDYKIEKALEKEFNINVGIDKVTYLYNKIDLNDNREDNVIAYIEGTKFCRNGGCTVAILEYRGDSYSVISKIIGAQNPIIISDEKTNGFKNIIMKVDIKNGESIYNELKFNGNSYPLNALYEPKVKKGNKIRGIAILADDLFYIKGIEI